MKLSILLLPVFLLPGSVTEPEGCTPGWWFCDPWLGARYACTAQRIWEPVDVLRCPLTEDSPYCVELEGGAYAVCADQLLLANHIFDQKIGCTPGRWVCYGGVPLRCDEDRLWRSQGQALGCTYYTRCVEYNGVRAECVR